MAGLALFIFPRGWVRALAMGLLLPFAAASTQAQELPRWTPLAVGELLQAAGEAEREGLPSSDYATDALRQALAAQDAVAIERRASQLFLELAHDFRLGRTPLSQRQAWHIAAPGWLPADAQALMAQAVATGTVLPSLLALLPANPEYQRLKEALAATPAQDWSRRRALMASLERWRWLPRDLGRRYLFVNVPEFSLEVVEDGVVSARHRVIVGKQATPTPQFSTSATGVIFNPVWVVPDSIVAESVGALLRRHPVRARALGYSATRAPEGRLVVRQAPGPANALGAVKLEMPNPFGIYLHDTPAKELFARPVRAYSHGCIRVDRPLDLARRLLAGAPGWDDAAIDAAVRSGATIRAGLAAPWTVYIVYLTARSSGEGLALFPDIYSRDAALNLATPAAEAFEIGLVESPAERLSPMC